MQIAYPVWKKAAVIVGAILLLLMLFYPFGYDQAVFSVGGELVVRHGAVPYRDFLDTKPPLIFYLYGLASLLFGHHEWSIRAFDILFHAATLLYFFSFLRRVTGDEKFALGSCFLYVLFYVTSGYWMTAQAETFALLPALVAFDLTEKSRISESSGQLARGIFSGLACAALFLLKFTLLTVPVGIIIYLFLSVRPFPKKYAGGMLAGFLVSIGCYILFLVATDSMTLFIESLTWVSNYAGSDPLFAVKTMIGRYFKQFPMLMMYPIGLSSLLIACIGILWFFQKNIEDKKSDPIGNNPVFILFFIQLMLGLLAVLYERKFFPYHYSRIYVVLIPFIVLGVRSIYRLWSAYRQSWMRLSPLQKYFRYAISAALAFVLVFYSTVPRLISQPAHFIYMHITGGDIGEDLENQRQYFYKEEKILADSLRPVLRVNDRIFVWGVSVGIYYFLRTDPTTICLTNTPFITSFTPHSWKEKLLGQVVSDHPRFFIAESGDDREYISGTSDDSWKYLSEWHDLKNFLDTTYRSRETIGHFRIFELR